MTELLLKEYKIQTTGADGGHDYIVTDIIHEGVGRRLVVLFKNKSQEVILSQIKPLRVKGKLEDSGIEHDLLMTETEIVLT